MSKRPKLVDLLNRIAELEASQTSLRVLLERAEHDRLDALMRLSQCAHDCGTLNVEIGRLRALVAASGGDPLARPPLSVV